MTRSVSKAIDNPYCKARIKASKRDETFLSREKASEKLGVSKDSLAQYELGLCKAVPVDKVVLMADTYNAPELLNNYCSTQCSIGQKIVEPIDDENVNNIYRFAVLTNNLLEDSFKIQKILLNIIDDGTIDKTKEEELAILIDFFKKIEMRTSEFKIIVESNKR